MIEDMLSGVAKKYYRTYKKLFDSFTEANYQGNAYGGTAIGGTKYALNVEKFDKSWYNEIKLSPEEQSRVQSEALTWDNDHRNVLRTRTLSNEITYIYMIDDEGLVHIYDKEQMINIHESGEYYANTNGEKLNKIAEELRSGQGNDGGNIGSFENRRNQATLDRRDNIQVRPERDSHRARNSNHVNDAHLRKKAVRYRFDQDGSGHGEVTYSDGSSKKFALPDRNSEGERRVF